MFVLSMLRLQAKTETLYILHGDGDVGQLDAETDGDYDIGPGRFFVPDLPCQFSFPTTQDF